MTMWDFLDKNGLWVVISIIIISVVVIGAIGSEFFDK